jgi:hypothetical protein
MRPVRAYVLLIAAILLTAFAAGILTLTAARGLAPVDSVNVALVRANFEAATQPELVIDLGTLVPRIGGEELLDPDTALPHSHRYDFEQLAALVRYAQTCADAPVVSEPLSKALAWHRYDCRQAELPAAFFETPPFMHPGGQSFAALAADQLGVKEHWLHITEWRWGINPPRELLASLDRAALPALGDPLVLDRRHVLIAHGESRHSYSVYSRRAWDAFLADQPLVPHPAKDKDACVIREGHACWSRNDAPFFARLGRMTSSLLVLTLGSAVVAALLLFRRQAQQRFVLQTLTHELRTPVASLLVSVELLRERYDEEHVLRVVDDAQRLRRLTENSRAYLGSGKLNPTRVESAGDWVRDLAGSDAQVEVLQDGPVTADTYWLAMCLKNLIDNANKHGEKPVVVQVRRGERLSIEVRDQGTLGAASKNAGLGLGLDIVRRTLKHMGGKLDVREKPTRFTVTL